LFLSLFFSLLHPYRDMVSEDFSDNTASPWALDPAVQPTPEASVATAVEKDRIIKDILTLRDGLRGLMVRVTEVESENERLKKDNEMLSVYIDNL